MALAAFGIGLGAFSEPARAQTVVTGPRPKLPPTSIPELPCATSGELDQLRAVQREWASAYNAYLKDEAA